MLEDDFENLNLLDFYSHEVDTFGPRDCLNLQSKISFELGVINEEASTSVRICVI